MSALTPRSILDAAARDICVRRDKLDGVLSHGVPYAFHAKHVDAAEDLFQLLELALKDPRPGLNSPKRLTRQIYRQEELLRLALGRDALARRSA